MSLMAAVSSYTYPHLLPGMGAVAIQPQPFGKMWMTTHKINLFNRLQRREFPAAKQIFPRIYIYKAGISIFKFEFVPLCKNWCLSEEFEHCLLLFCYFVI